MIFSGSSHVAWRLPKGPQLLGHMPAQIRQGFHTIPGITAFILRISIASSFVSLLRSANQFTAIGFGVSLMAFVPRDHAPQLLH